MGIGHSQGRKGQARKRAEKYQKRRNLAKDSRKRNRRNK